jgi:hypothetical protein
MEPSEVRRRILADHERLRGVLLSIESLGRGVLGGSWEAVAPLRLEGETLHQMLFEHMSWEDRYLAPALRDAGAWGGERAGCLDRDHREQRELLEHTLVGLRDPSRPSLALARTMVDLVALLRTDMQDEEETILDPRLLLDVPPSNRAPDQTR